KVVDNVHGSCVISASQSMENVYTALVLTLEVLNSGKSPDVIKGSIVRILPVGDLEVGEEENFKFNLDFPAVRVANANLDFYFFYGEGKHIATNLSQRLKKLSSEQLEQLRAMQRKGVE
ncbi:MAG: hypothetical protein KJT03_07330, partial [Verrucomicrobiae bacterium]|nr:hypothetical protein [Verrucomicrobiae bacterium]